MMTPPESSVLVDPCVIFSAKLSILLELEFKDISMISISVTVQHNLFGKYGRADKTFDPWEGGGRYYLLTNEIFSIVEKEILKNSLQLEEFSV